MYKLFFFHLAYFNENCYGITYQIQNLKILVYNTICSENFFKTSHFEERYFEGKPFIFYLIKVTFLQCKHFVYK